MWKQCGGSILFTPRYAPDNEKATWKQYFWYLLTLAEESGVTGGHAGVLKDGVERAGGLHRAALGGAGWQEPIVKVDWPVVKTQPGFVPILKNQKRDSINHEY